MNRLTPLGLKLTPEVAELRNKAKLLSEYPVKRDLYVNAFYNKNLISIENCLLASGTGAVFEDNVSDPL